MLLLEQLELAFEKCSRPALSGRLVAQRRGDRAPRLQQNVDLAVVGRALRLPTCREMVTGAVALQCQKGRDGVLEQQTCHLLRTNGASRIAADVRVEWNSRLKTCAGRANYRTKVISLNPRLREHPTEIERTLRHELAHFLAQFRAGRRRMLPHGEEWRAACRDLGIGDEKRCHNLPFPVRERARRFLYRCPSCARDFPRVRKIRRAIACLACCRAHSRGRFDARFRLQVVAAR
jgi:SprT protein